MSTHVTTDLVWVKSAGGETQTVARTVHYKGTPTIRFFATPLAKDADDIIKPVSFITNNGEQQQVLVPDSRYGIACEILAPGYHQALLHVKIDGEALTPLIVSEFTVGDIQVIRNLTGEGRRQMHVMRSAVAEGRGLADAVNPNKGVIEIDVKMNCSPVFKSMPTPQLSDFRGDGSDYRGCAGNSAYRGGGGSGYRGGGGGGSGYRGGGSSDYRGCAAGSASRGGAHHFPLETASVDDNTKELAMDAGIAPAATVAGGASGPELRIATYLSSTHVFSANVVFRIGVFDPERHVLKYKAVPGPQSLKSALGGGTRPIPDTW